MSEYVYVRANMTCYADFFLRFCYSDIYFSFLIIMNLNYLLFSCLWMGCRLCITLLIVICDECIFDYFMYVCVCIYWAFLLCVICRLSVVCLCFGVVVFYLRTCNSLLNVFFNRPSILLLTIIILTLFIIQSICAERKMYISCNFFMDSKVFKLN